VKLLIFMSNSRSRYGIIAFPHSFRISPETLFGRTDLFLPVAANLLTILVLMVNGSHELMQCICEILHSKLNKKLKHSVA
jgi:hypothetical protein